MNRRGPDIPHIFSRARKENPDLSCHPGLGARSAARAAPLPDVHEVATEESTSRHTARADCRRSLKRHGGGRGRRAIGTQTNGVPIMKTTTFLRRVLVSSATVLAASALSGPPGAYAQESATATPIKHVIIVVGENHTFDNLFGTYKPRAGQTVDNLLSKRIVNADGSPGPDFSRGQQLIGSDTDGYHAVTASTGSYDALPIPYTTY